MPTPNHTKAVRLDNEVRQMRSDLDLCTIGLARWCVDYLADESPLHSPSMDPGHGGDDTPVERAALADHHDVFIDHAKGYTKAIERHDMKAAVEHARFLWGHVEKNKLADMCRRCGKPLDRNGRRGDCGACVKAEQRERERVA